MAKTFNISHDISTDFNQILINLKTFELTKDNILKILNDSLSYITKFKEIYSEIEIEGEFKYHLDNLQKLLKNIIKVGFYLDNYMNFVIWPNYEIQIDVMNYSNMFSYFDVTRSMQGSVSSSITNQVARERKSLIDFKVKIADFINGTVKCIGDKDISSFKLDFDSSSVGEMFNDELDLKIELLFESIINILLGNIKVFESYSDEITELEKRKHTKKNSALHF